VFNEIALSLPGASADFFIPDGLATEAAHSKQEKLSLYDFNSGKVSWQGLLSKKTQPTQHDAKPMPIGSEWRVEWDMRRALEHYTELFKLTMEQVHSGTCKKIVPSVGISGNWTGDWDTGLDRIRQSLLKPSPFYRHWLVSDDKLSVGHSPELLISKSHSKNFFETRALAGTSEVDGPTEAWSSKLKDEHRWVVDDIHQQLSSLGLLQTLPTHVLPAASNLFHLETPMQFVPKNECPASELVSVLHPTAALGLLPRGGVSLEELYRGDFLREGFGAPICWQKTSDEFTIWIRIRSIDFLRSGECRCVVGGGLVMGSEFSEEWSEIQKKLRATLEALGLNFFDLHKAKVKRYE
jgi:isochorismate synthase EntC